MYIEKRAQLTVTIHNGLRYAYADDNCNSLCNSTRCSPAGIYRFARNDLWKSEIRPLGDDGCGGNCREVLDAITVEDLKFYIEFYVYYKKH